MEEESALVAIDITLEVAQSDGVAYYRVTPEFRDFLMRCFSRQRIIGFEWTPGALNFGVLLGSQDQGETV